MKIKTVLIVSLVLILALLSYFFMNPDKGDNFSEKAINVAEETPGKIEDAKDTAIKTKEAIDEVKEGIDNVKEIFGDDLVECPEILSFGTPVDLSEVASILYPGQVRGGDYKPHGGFRFDDSNTEVSVKIPIDSYLVRGSRYLEEGEVQYLFEFNTDCNVSYRFDHLFTLSSKLQEIADTLPEAKEGDSRTTRINNIEFTKGEEVATEIGTPGNSFVDFGIYDYRKENEASKTSELIEAYPSDLAKHAVCWFDWLSSEDSEIVKNLPATADDSSSEYC